METTKLCTKCEQQKPIHYFVKKSKHHPDANTEWCKTCKRRESNRKNTAKMRSKDDNYRLYRNITEKLRYEIKKPHSTKRELFEEKFEDWMSWENYGKEWEIDHIEPVLKMIEEGKSESEINHIDNIRPLSIYENRTRKNN